MFRPRMTVACTAVVALLSVLVVSGCKKQDQPAASAEKPSATAAAPAAAAVDEKAVEAVLAKADAYDGTEDKVISKCGGCSLHMDGSSDYSLQAHGYTMHFCSVDCKSTFEKDPDKAILAMAVPGE